MRAHQACLAVLQLILTVGIAREPAAETREPFAGQVPPIAVGTENGSSKDDLAGFKLLKHEYPELRALGAKLLTNLGANAAPAIPDLIALLGDEHIAERDGMIYLRTVGEVASLALASIGPKAVPALADAMVTRPEKQARIAAACTLVELFDKSDQKPLIFQRLDRAVADPDEAMRRVAVNGLGRLGTVARPALARLIEIGKSDSSELVRFEVVNSLPLVDPKGEMVMPRLIESLQDRSADVSGVAARTLGKFGPLAKSSVPALTAALDDPRDRHQALTPDFIVMLALRCDVAEALGRIGIEAHAAIPALRRIVVRDRKAEVRVSAALALTRIDPEYQGALLAIITEVEVKGKDTHGRLAAIEALDELGPKARAAVPALLRCIANDNSDIRWRTAKALGAIGDRAAITSLKSLLADTDDSVHAEARASLEKLGDPEE